MNINETTQPIHIEGESKSWERARLITITNNYNKTPELTFIDEKITVSPIGEKHEGLPAITVKFDPTVEFDLLNPLTDEIIGKAKFQDLQVILYSLYIYEKNKTLSMEHSPITRPLR